jgi:hypothetical protein
MFEYRINPRIAQVVSTRSYIPYFGFGDHLDDYRKEPEAKIRLKFSVENDLNRPPELSEKSHFFYGKQGTDRVYYERPLGLGIELRMMVTGLLTPDPEIVVNGSYYKYVRARIDNVFPPGVHLVDALSLKLIEGGYLQVHCAALSRHKEGILLVAPPDTGKSTTTLSAIKNGYHFVSEDIAFIDGENVYANPHTGTFYHLEAESTSPLKSLRFRFSDKPVISYFMETPNAKVSSLMQDAVIDEMVKVHYVFILDRGEPGVEHLDEKEALRRFTIINRYEFSYHKNPLLLSYSYFNPALDINRHMRLEEQRLESIVGKSECFLLRSNDPKQYVKLMMQAVKSK